MRTKGIPEVSTRHQALRPLRQTQPNQQARRINKLANLHWSHNAGTSRCEGVARGGLRLIVGAKKIVARDTCLREDCPQSRGFEVRVVRHSQWRACAIGILAYHRDMATFANCAKAQALERTPDSGHWRVHRKLSHHTATRASVTNTCSSERSRMSHLRSSFTWRHSAPLNSKWMSL